MDPKPIRVAVLGTGLAGLVAGHLLHTLQFEKEDGTPLLFQVELYEKSASLGMDNASISVEQEGGSFRLDTPMRSINGGSHSKVFRLYQHLDIALRRSDFSYSFSRLSRVPPRPTSPPLPPYSERAPTPHLVEKCASSVQPAQTPRYIYEGSNGMTFPPLALPSPVASASLFTRFGYLLHLVLLSLSYLHLLLLAFFYSSAGLTGRSTARGNTARRIADLLRLPSVADEPVEEWCRRHWIWNGMMEEVLVPLYAAVSTVGRIEAKEMPVGECLDYIVSTFGSSHYVAEVGVQQVVRRLAAPFPLDSIHVSSTITGMSRISSATAKSQLQLAMADSSAPKPFDHIVFATQANQAAALLSFLPSDASLASLIAALQQFAYVPTLVVNHTDESILPPIEADRRDLNLASFEPPSSPLQAKFDRMDEGTDTTMPVSSVQATHVISRTHPRLQGSASSLLLQTTNPLVPISPSHILSSTWYERAKVCRESKAVLPRFILGVEGGGDLQGAVEGVWMCGSWCAEGIPLLEGCVSSAMEVVKALVKKEGGREVRMPF